MERGGRKEGLGGKEAGGTGNVRERGVKQKEGSERKLQGERDILGDWRRGG